MACSKTLDYVSRFFGNFLLAERPNPEKFLSICIATFSLTLMSNTKHSFLGKFRGCEKTESGFFLSESRKKLKFKYFWSG